MCLIISQVFVEDTPDSAQVAGSGQFDDASVVLPLPHTLMMTSTPQGRHHPRRQDQPEPHSPRTPRQRH